MNRRTKTRLTANIVIAVLVAVAWIQMILGNEELLASGGLSSLKYFTTLSNVFEGISCIIWIILNVNFAKSEKGNRLKNFTDALKYAASVCVALTFLTVIIFLGPMFGYDNMFTHANLWFHLVIPLLSMAEFVFFNQSEVRIRENFAAVVPMLLYGTVYLVNILLNGVSEFPNTNDLYGFATWGIPIGVVIFAALCGITYGIGLALRLLNKRLQIK